MLCSRHSSLLQILLAAILTLPACGESPSGQNEDTSNADVVEMASETLLPDGKPPETLVPDPIDLPEDVSWNPTDSLDGWTSDSLDVSDIPASDVVELVDSLVADGDDAVEAWDEPDAPTLPEPALCEGNPYCNDGDPCTKDDCVPGTGCIHSTLPDGTICDEGWECLAGECICPVDCSNNECGASCGVSCGDCLDLDVCIDDECLPPTLVVNSANDDDTCTSDYCTLRGAINQANALPGLDIIAFDLTEETGYLIETAMYPHITDDLAIDGTTQSGSPTDPPVRIVFGDEDSSLEEISPWHSACLHFDMSRAIIRGLSLDCQANGPGASWPDLVLIKGGAQHVIQGCRLVDNYLDDKCCEEGLTIFSAQEIVIGGSHPNAGNTFHHGWMFYLAVWDLSNLVVQGNRIGPPLSPDSTPNWGFSGSYIDTVDGALIGGRLPGAANQFLDQWHDISYSSDVRIEGNRFGTDAEGTERIGDFERLTIVGVKGLEIGCSLPGCANVFGAGYNGTSLEISDCIEARIYGNRFDVDTSGTKPLTGSEDSWHSPGVSINGGQFIEFGGPFDGQANVLAGGLQGSALLWLGGGNYWYYMGYSEWGEATRIRGNYFGVGLDDSPLPVAGSCIELGGAPDTIIGGLHPAEGNTIGNCWSTGIHVIGMSTDRDAAILGNRILNSGGLGIDLGGEGAEAIDLHDTDIGPNGLQNAPVLISAISGEDGVLLVGQLVTTPATLFRIELFASSTCTEDARAGEYLAKVIEVTTDASGNAGFTVIAPDNNWPGHYMTATSTPMSPGGMMPTGGTSEFSNCLLAKSAISENAPPVAVVDSVALPEDSPLVFYPLANDLDPTGEGLVVTDIYLMENEASGQAALADGGTAISYSPAPDYWGTNMLLYEVTDGIGATAWGIVHIAVLPQNDPPVANPDYATAVAAKYKFISVLDNDTDIDGDGLVIAKWSQPSAGSVTLTGSGKLYFDAPQQPGEYSFEYTVEDANGAVDSALVVVRVVPPDLETVTVNSPDDINDGLCGIEHCSLREAFNLSNLLKNSTQTITFQLPGSPPHKISLLEELPELLDPTHLDGRTQPGYAGTPVVHLDGALIPDEPGHVVLGIVFLGGQSSITGLALTKFEAAVRAKHGSGNVVQGNYLGVLPSGVTPASNSVGVLVSWSEDCLIGGEAPGQGNIIVAGIGVKVWQSSGTRIEGNKFGILANESLSPTGTSNAIYAWDSEDIAIGGTAVAAGNSIARGKSSGILISDSNAAILGNSIYANKGGSIKLNYCKDFEDPGDVDEGANGCQNYPQLTEALHIGSGVQVTGTLDSMAESKFTIQLFANKQCHESGRGEGQDLVGSFEVETATEGPAPFDFHIDEYLSPGTTLTATVTRWMEVEGEFKPAETSEFSPCILVSE
jgi:CSLREA domain-containing protein